MGIVSARVHGPLVLGREGTSVSSVTGSPSMSARTSTVRPGRPPSRVATAPVSVGPSSGVRPMARSRSVTASVVVRSANETSGWA